MKPASVNGETRIRTAKAQPGSAPSSGSVDLSVGQLKKQLERVPDNASVCMMVLGHCAAPRRVIWCVKDNGVIITSERDGYAIGVEMQKRKPTTMKKIRAILRGKESG